MNTLALFKKYYLYNKESFLSSFNGENSAGNIDKNLIQNLLVEISNEIASISNSSIVQMDLEGNVIFTSNEANFANTKEEIKKISGSVEKVGDKYFLVGDVKNKKATVLKIEYTTILDIVKGLDLTVEEKAFYNKIFSGVNSTVGSFSPYWEYTSDRFVSSFRLIKEMANISINESYIEKESTNVEVGDEIAWVNNSNSPIYIYSGYTTYDIFNSNPDFNLYGKEFSSGIINPRETWSTKINSSEEIDWFAYPFIVTGKIVPVEKGINKRDKFLICEDDGLDVPFTSRIIKVDNNGQVIWSWGGGYIIRPKSARSLESGNIIISS